MSRRRGILLSAGIVAGCACLAFGTVAMLAPHDGSAITKVNFERIEPGMTGKQVEEILGGLSGNYASRPVLDFPARKRMPLEERWLSDSFTIAVEFDKERTVIACHGAPPWFMRETFTDKLRRWLRLPRGSP